MEILSVSSNIAKSEIVINKSRFLGFVTHVESVEDAQHFLDSIRSEYKDARHICFAYRLKNTSKASDDGEPSGTAGKPILQIIEKQNLFDTIIVVVRYFGGIKLGAGGLLRAYSNCATDCLSNTQKEIFYSSILYKISLEYKDYQTFLNKIKNRFIEVLESDFDNGANLTIVARDDEIISDAIQLGKIMHSYKNKEST